MIKFFRKIRRDLLSNGKTGKPVYRTGRYLKYAVGEIILVVIGILIALQLNNWNENQKLDTLKKNYLQSLLVDLKEDSLQIENRITYAEERISEYENYEKMFDSIDMTLPRIRNGLSKINAATLTLTFRTNTLEVLKSTGDIKLIPEEIRNKAFDLNRKQEYVDHIIKRNTTIYLEQIQEIGKLGWNQSAGRLNKNEHILNLIKNINIDLKSVENIFAVESVYRHKYEIESVIKRQYESLLIDIEELTQLIMLDLN